MEVTTFIDNNKNEAKKICSKEDAITKLDQAINDIIQKEGYVKYKVQKETISTNGGNYLGILYEVDVKGTTNDGDKETNIFIKSIVNGDKMTFISINDVYQTELFAYRELSDIFAELQENTNVPLQERFKMVKSYNASSNTEAIILENISRKGYKTFNRIDIASLEFIEMCIKELAKFHGLSFVLQETRREYFDKNIKPMKYPIIFKEDWRNFIASMYNLIVKYVDDDIIDKVQNTYFKISEKCVEYMHDETLWMCLCHGDYRPNNIMAKIRNEKVEDVIPVDYQLLHYGCPIFDIMYLIYTSTDRKFRKAHLSHIKDLYHNTLKKFMFYFDIDVELVFPREKFEQIFKDKLDYGLLVGYLYLPFMLASEDDVPDLTQELSGLSFQLKDTYKDRLRDIIDDLVEWGFIV